MGDEVARAAAELDGTKRVGLEEANGIIEFLEGLTEAHASNGDPASSHGVSESLRITLPALRAYVRENNGARAWVIKAALDVALAS